RDRVGDRLEDHGLTGPRRRDDESALSLADRSDQVENARGHVGGLKADAILRIERREVVEEDLLARDIRVLEIDRLDLDEREITLPLLGRADLARNGVARAQIEFPDLGRRDVDVVRSGQVVVLWSAQETEAVRQALEHTFREDQPL